MTNKAKPRQQVRRRSTRKPRVREGLTSRWLLRDAKARFSELVRRARTEGPQHVTVYGRDEVVIVAAEEFRRLKRELTGQELIDVLRSAPLDGVDIEPHRSPMPVRDVTL